MLLLFQKLHLIQLLDLLTEICSICVVLRILIESSDPNTNEVKVRQVFYVCPLAGLDCNMKGQTTQVDFTAHFLILIFFIKKIILSFGDLF